MSPSSRQRSPAAVNMQFMPPQEDAKGKPSPSTPGRAYLESHDEEEMMLQIESCTAQVSPKSGKGQKSDRSSRLIGVAVVSCNFSTSVLLVSSVKYLYTAYTFQFPMFIAVVHMILSWIATAVVIFGVRGGTELMPLRERFVKVFPFTVFNAASIASANAALTLIYPSFHEMIQSTTPLFTLLASVLIDGKRYNGWAYFAIIPLCGGAAISSYNEVNFSLAGSLFSLLAVVFRALKTLLQGRLLCDQKVDSITLCFYMAPYNLLIFLVACLVLEGAAPLDELLEQGSDLVLALGVSSGLACCFNIASCYTIQYLNPVGAVVIANAKTPAIILVSVLIFGNSVLPLQLMGFLMTFFGVWLHGHKGQVVK